MPRVIDLTLPTRKHWRWFARVMLWHDFADGDNFRHSFMTINAHGFTHADAPNHFLPEGSDIAGVPLEKYFGEAVVVDLSHVGANQPVTAEDLEEHAADVREGDIVLLRTDWPLKTSWESLDFWGEAPYTHRSACDWLIDRKVKLVGYDYPPDFVLRYQVTDPRRQGRVTKEENDTHHLFFPRGIAVIEYLTNLHLIQKRRVQFFALPIPFEGADGSPVRAIAIED
jgi:arylformamidase